MRDLVTWETLYVAGRMHKPVATLASDTRVATAADANLRAALACALLLLPVRVARGEHGLARGGSCRARRGAVAVSCVVCAR